MSITQLLTLIGVAGTLLGTLLGGGGVAAWFLLGPRRRKITIDAAHDAVLIHSGVLKDVRDEVNRLSNELAQMQMEGMALEKAHQDCEKRIQDLESQLQVLRREVDLARLSRRKAHLAIHTLGNYELHIDLLLDEMRKQRLAITPLMRPHKIRAAFQAEMAKIEEMESTITEQTVKPIPPPAKGEADY